MRKKGIWLLSALGIFGAWGDPFFFDNIFGDVIENTIVVDSVSEIHTNRVHGDKREITAWWLFG